MAMLVSQEADRPLTGLYGAGIDMTAKRWESVGPDHPIAIMAHSLSDRAYELAAVAGISRWDLCVAMANAIGHVLADSAKPPPEGVVLPNRNARKMPREAALERFDSLREIMQTAYDTRDTKGSA